MKQPQPQVYFQGVVGRFSTLQCSHFREGVVAYVRCKAELSLILLRVLVFANCTSRIFVLIDLFRFNLAVQYESQNSN